ncbi:MAG: tRNA (N(6)-L-threonylcarbamoyladenosine(37)-C(2))-methylthiotransferase MtaB [Planctomycetota bacterium]
MDVVAGMADNAAAPTSPMGPLVQLEMPVLPLVESNDACEPLVPKGIHEELLPARLVTLGCKVNQYETEYVRELLLQNGYREAERGESAVLAVVNTCTVTSESDRKSRKLIYQMARANPGAKIVVMGCYATAEPETIRRLPGVAAVVTDKRNLAGALKPFGVQRDVRGIRRFEGHQRAFVKVQDGCILDCTFCIIPKVRPGLLSRNPDDIVEEVRRLVDAGYREIVMTGIHLGHYGVDLSQGRPRREWCRLWHLLDRIATLPGDFRIRLSSLEATEVTDDFVRVLAEHSGRICPHLHLSLQSGSDAVLARMKRRYRVKKFVARCEQLRSRLDQPAFTTDIIVGFPGETDADFDATCDVVRAVGFSKLHLFPFSARRGTEAADFGNKVSDVVLGERMDRLSRLGAEVARDYYESLIGRRLEMLVETPHPERSGMMRGTACRYAPLLLETLPSLRGRLVPVQAVRWNHGFLEVAPVHED